MGLIHKTRAEQVIRKTIRKKVWFEDKKLVLSPLISYTHSQH